MPATGRRPAGVAARPGSGLMKNLESKMTCPSVSVPKGAVYQSNAQYAEYTDPGWWLHCINNGWGPDFGTQTLWAFSPDHWGVISNQPWVPYNVQSYPSVVMDMAGAHNSATLSQYTEISSTADQSMPSGAG